MLVNVFGALAGRTGSYLGSDANQALETAYTVLKEKGYDDEHIVLLSDTIPKGRRVDKGINARATAENTKNVLESLAKRTQNGSLLIQFGGHSNSEGKFQFNADESEISPQTVAEILNANTAKKIFIVNSCYSGKWVELLKELRGEVCILSSAKEDKRSVSGYSKHFWENLQKGTSIDEAYQSAMRKHNEKMTTKVVKTVVGDTTQDAPFIYNPRHLQIGQEKSKGLEKKVWGTFSIAFLMIGLVSLVPSVTGNSIGASHSSGAIEGIGLLLMSLICGLLHKGN